MEYQISANGKKLYSTEFKTKVLSELGNGATVHELSRKYSVDIQNLVNWKKSRDQAVIGRQPKKSTEEQIPANEYRRILEENKNLRKSLVNMTMDRDILKEAVDIASKKKWI